MEMPTDRSYAVISRNADGTATVQIATAIEKGQPKRTNATYVGTWTVRVDPAIRMVRTASHQDTTSAVEVAIGGGTAITPRVPRSLAA